MQLFDTHCHLDYDPLLADAAQWLAEGWAQGITATLVPATTLSRFAHISAFVRQHESTYLALGLHPVYLPEHSDAALDAVGEWIRRESPLAVGEVGLDYFVETLDHERQQLVFERMIGYAQQFDLPMVLHVRRAHDAMIGTLKRMKFKGGGIAHAFAGSAEQAAEFIKLGFKLGFGGVMSYESARRVRKLAHELPLDSIVLETDAPDMAPVNWPLAYNTPLALLRNFQALCDLRSEAPDRIAAQTTSNACVALRLSDRLSAS